MSRVNLLDFDAAQLAAYVDALGEKPFRGRQLLRWIHRRGAREFDAMSDLAKSLRAKLSQQAHISCPGVLSDAVAADGTRKWLLDVGLGNAIEAVFIPEEDRGTLCISTQAGCAVNCVFCSTGRQGFNRNLTTAEIIGQLWMAEHMLRAGAGAGDSDRDRVISNVVLMGMGEPLQNYDAVLPALRLMLDDNAYGLSRRRVTVSTSGMVPLIDRLAVDCPFALAVSLPCIERCVARHPGAAEQKVPAARVARRVPSLFAHRTARLHHVRVCNARRRQRQRSACGRAGRTGR